MICSYITSERSDILGGYLQQHINHFTSRQFKPEIIHLDPQPGFNALVGHFGDIEVDIVGAGDHLPQALMKSIVFYAVNRLNSRRDYLNTLEASPKILFLGFKHDYKTEFSIGFGDYCECPCITPTTNRATDQRTESCIALYPCNNRNGSWNFYNISTNTITETNDSNSDANDIETTTNDDHVDSTVTASEEINNINEEEDNEEDDYDIIEHEDMDEMNTTDHFYNDSNNDDDSTLTRLRDRSKIKLPARFQVNHISIKRALHEYGKDGEDAAMKEMNQLLNEKKVMSPVNKNDIPENIGYINSHMFIKDKQDAQGNHVKYKARLVADGSMQLKELYDDISSPTIKLSSVFTLLSIAVKNNFKVGTIDIAGAYLNADMDDEVFIKLNPTLTEIALKCSPNCASYIQDKCLYMRLNKALYGCVQSAKLWYTMVSNFFKSIGFKQSNFDCCVF